MFHNKVQQIFAFVFLKWLSIENHLSAFIGCFLFLLSLSLFTGNKEYFHLKDHRDSLRFIKTSTEASNEAQRSKNNAPCVSCFLLLCFPPTQASLQPIHLNPASQSDTVARDRLGNLWRCSSGKIMSSHRPEIGHRVCVSMLQISACVSLFLLFKYRETVVEREGEIL